MTRPKGIIETKPRRPRKGPRRLSVLTMAQARALLRLRAALKVAQRERAALLLAIASVPIRAGGTRPARRSQRQDDALSTVAKGIAAAQTGLRELQMSVEWNVKGKWVENRPPPLSIEDAGERPWLVWIRLRQSEAENARLRRLVHVQQRLGRDVG